MKTLELWKERAMQRMTDDWYRLLRAAHYLGYHTRPAMSYDFDQARDFSLVLST